MAKCVLTVEDAEDAGIKISLDIGKEFPEDFNFEDLDGDDLSYAQMLTVVACGNIVDTCWELADGEK